MTDGKKHLTTHETAKHVGLGPAATDFTFGDPLDTMENDTGGTGGRHAAALPLGRRPGWPGAPLAYHGAHGHGDRLTGGR